MNVVLLTVDCQSSRLVFNALDQLGLNIQSVVIEEPISRAKLVKGRLKKLGFFKVAGQLAFQLAAVPLLKVLVRGRIKELSHGLEGGIPPEKISHVSSVNSNEVRTLLAEMSPNLVLVVGTRIIGRKTLSCIDAPFVNIHAGITPLYRGVHGGYWALVQRDKVNCGVTVHLVDEGIDTGSIIAQSSIAPTPADNFVTYPILQTIRAVDLIAESWQSLKDGTFQTVPPPSGESKLWYHPTLFEYLRYRLARGVA